MFRQAAAGLLPCAVCPQRRPPRSLTKETKPTKALHLSTATFTGWPISPGQKFNRHGGSILESALTLLRACGLANVAILSKPGILIFQLSK